MALPDSRNFTYDANLPIRSYDLNQMQDMLIALGARPKLEVFESNGTYTKPSWAKYTEFIAVGRGGLAGSNFSGTVIGGGGGAGFPARGTFIAAGLRTSIAIVVARHDTADTESTVGAYVNDTSDYRLLRARSGGNGGNASAGLGGGGGDGWAGGGGGQATGGTGGIGGLGYGDAYGQGGILAPSSLSYGTGPGGSGMNGGNGTTSDSGTGGGRTRSGTTGGSAGAYATGGSSPLIAFDSLLFGAQEYGRGASGAGAGAGSTPGNGVVIAITFGNVNLASIPY